MVVKRLATVLVIACALPVFAYAQAELFVHNFHRVNDQVWRGAQPGVEGVRALAAEKVHTILDLRNGEERTAEEKKTAESLGLTYVNVPLNGYGAPTADQVKKILGVLNDKTQWPVFVHCKYGKDRTGTAIACYRIQHDHWDNQKALEEAKGMGMHSMERSMKGYIVKFTPQELPADAQKTEPVH
jgi:tyrosine-protein phosphatase SIW14